MKHKTLYLFSIILSLTISASINAQDFDDEFLESLPEGVKEDLMKRNSDKEELEEDRYRRPSSYIEKKDSRKKLDNLQIQLDILQSELSESKEGDVEKRFGSKIFSLMQTSLMPFNEPNFDGS